MIVTVFWLLLAVSDGGYNGGTVTVVATYASKDDCTDSMAAARQDTLLNRNTNWSCLIVKRPSR